MLRQLGLAIHNFADTKQEKFPMLGEAQEGGHWTAFILPYIEQGNVADALTFGSTDFASSAARNNASITSPDRIERQIAACELVIPAFRCPSSVHNAPIFDASVYSPPWFVAARQPANYLAVVTGIQPNDWKPSWGWGRSNRATWGSGQITKSHAELDGIFGTRHPERCRLSQGGMGSSIRFADVVDGLSNTLMLGEAEPDPDLASIASTQESQNTGRKDHWAIGGDDFDNWEGTDWSEMGGSTAVAVNYKKPVNDRITDGSATWAAYEVSFGSNHPGLAQFCNGDGSITTVSDEIDPVVFSGMGTRKGKEVASADN